MYIEQLYTNCLAEAAYFIESDGEAAIIDPIRDTDIYLQKAASKGAKIKYIFETHFHADFVSGHLDLAAKTGGTIVFGPGAETNYKSLIASDNQEFRIGKLTIRVLHTPGHTPESTCYLLIDENGKDHAVFTGDTLFVGDVGRPDLLGGKITKEELASMMFDSLRTKLLPLADDVIVYPAHGPGSACGKHIGKETWSTIGAQKKSNYAMQDQSREEFIEKVTVGLSEPPPYFFSDARINKEGYTGLDEVVSRNMNPLSPSAFKELADKGTYVLDTRNPDDFEKGFVPGSVNIGLNGTFAVWVGALVDISKPMILVCDPGKEEEAIVRLARVGFEKISGYLNGGFKSYLEAGLPVDTVESIDPGQFAEFYGKQGFEVLDVRKPGETEAGYVKGAVMVPLNRIDAVEKGVAEQGKLLIHCAGGYRSMIAASILKKKGITNLINVRGGYAKIKEQNALVDTVVPA